MSCSLFSVLNSRYGRRVSVAERREFLKGTLAASAGLLLSTNPGHAMVGHDSRRRVIIVGAGLAGLACGYELQSIGHDVTILEARRRIGGRVFSSNSRNGNEFAEGRNVEFGGELIGSNHPAWVNYAERFGLSFLDVTEDAEAELPVVIGGKRLTPGDAKQLWSDLETALTSMNKLAEPVPEDEPWMAPDAQRLDHTSIQKWIDEMDAPDIVKRAVWVNQTADNGQAPKRQSLLGQLAAVKGGGLERYWTESEVYRCKGGNDLLAQKFTGVLGAERIRPLQPVRSITRHDAVVVVASTDGHTFECDDVVLTAAPSVWDRIEFSPALDRQMMPQMGCSAKYFAHVRNRFWEGQHPKLSQYGLSDGWLQMTWDGTDNQDFSAGETNTAVLVGFTGGSTCEEAGNMTRENRDRIFSEAMEQLFPGFRAEFLRSAYMNWSRDPWTRAGYSFPAPGQVTTVAPWLATPHMDGHLHLAGEHTCCKFVGYMEGALQSGIRVAKRIAACAS